MIKSILSNWSVIILSALSVLILYPFFLEQFGQEKYGVWLLISSIVGYFTLLQLGVPAATVRFVTRTIAEDDHEGFRNYANSSLLFFLMIGGICLIMTPVLLFSLTHFYQIPENFIQMAKLALAFAVVEVLVRFLFQVFESIIHAHQKFLILSVIKNLATIFRLIATILFINSDSGLQVIAYILVLSALLQGVLTVFVVKKLAPDYRPSLTKKSFSLLKTIFSYSVLVLLLQVASRLSFRTDAIVIGKFVSISDIVVFGIASSLLIYLMDFVVAISRVLMPKFTHMSVEGTESRQAFSEYYLHGSRYIAYVLAGISAIAAVFAEPFFRLWVGEEFSVESARVTAVLLIGYAVFLVQRGIAFPYFMAVDKLKIPVVIFFVAALVNIGLSIYLATTMGLVGVAWGTTVPNIVAAIAFAIYALILTDTSWGKYFLISALLPMIYGLVMFAGLNHGLSLVEVNDFFGLLFFGGLSAIIGFIVWFAVFSAKSDKHYILNKVLRMRA